MQSIKILQIRTYANQLNSVPQLRNSYIFYLSLKYIYMLKMLLATWKIFLLESEIVNIIYKRSVNAYAAHITLLISYTKL